jgi:hypothetical protein
MKRDRGFESVSLQQRVGTNRESTGSAAEKLERAEFQLGKFGMGAASFRIYFFFPRGFP